MRLKQFSQKLTVIQLAFFVYFDLIWFDAVVLFFRPSTAYCSTGCSHIPFLQKTVLKNFMVVLFVNIWRLRFAYTIPYFTMDWITKICPKNMKSFCLINQQKCYSNTWILCPNTNSLHFHLKNTFIGILNHYSFYT